MAKIAKDHKFQRRVKYPLDKWLDGTKWELIQGVDFKIRPRHLQNHLQNMARRRKLKLVTNLIGKSLYVQAIPRPTDSPKPNEENG